MLLPLVEEDDEDEEEEDEEVEADWLSYLLWDALRDGPASLWLDLRKERSSSGLLTFDTYPINSISTSTVCLFITKHTTDRPVLIFASCLCTVPGADQQLVAGFVAVLLDSSTSSSLLFVAQKRIPTPLCLSVKAACLRVS